MERSQDPSGRDDDALRGERAVGLEEHARGREDVALMANVAKTPAARSSPSPDDEAPSSSKRDASSGSPSPSATTTLDARFRPIFDAEFGYVCRVLCRFGVATADLDDAAQETFVAIHRHLATYDPSRPLRPWLSTFAFHVAANYRRLARHRYETDEPGDDTRAQEDTEARHEAKSTLLRALDRLSTVRRDVFVMHDIESLEAKEIATLLGVPLNTVYSRLRLAREDMERFVRELEETPG